VLGAPPLAPFSVLVIGGGPAGTFAAISARKQRPDADVTLLTEEHCEPYEKPPLSKAVLVGKAHPLDAQIAGPSGVVSHAVVLECHAHCEAIDRDARAVALRGGRRLPYDTLVIATGATARELPHLPIGMSGVHYLRTEADAHRLKAELRADRSLLVVGGGLIGLEVAASASELGVHTTVLEAEPRVLARVCDEETGAVVHAAHRDRGVDIRLATKLKTVTSQPDGSFIVETDTGDRLRADLIVVGIGSTPNDRLAADAGLAVDDGVVVDERCRTSDRFIFAAGDVVRFPGPQGLVRLENWRHALDQGGVAGRNAAGADEVYASVPSFWSEQYDLYVQGVGWSAPGNIRVRRPVAGKTDILFEVSGDCLVYAMGINVQRDLSMARRLIERRVPVDPAELADPAKPLAAMLKR
jgi:3-phenylpropionate/trans-cinnamate dioxygenase ferredoxin reductase component